MPFCYGLSIEYFSIKLLYDGITEEQTIFAHNIQTGVALMFQNFLLIEAAMNIILYKKLYLNDEAMIGPLPIEKIQLRHKCSAINLTGQIIAFIVETIVQLLTQVFLHSIFAQNSTYGITAYPCYIIITSSIVSIAQFVSSPEMKRFYLKQNI